MAQKMGRKVRGGSKKMAMRGSGEMGAREGRKGA